MYGYCPYSFMEYFLEIYSFVKTSRLASEMPRHVK